MSEAQERIKPGVGNAIPVRGQYHRFMLLPVMPQHAEWIEAGPVTFAIEGRVLGDGKGSMERGATLHVFSADRAEEYARFDCFDIYPHYHYILNDLQHNIVWGYDPDVNGPMAEWAIEAVRRRLPAILRHAHAPALAERVEREGLDPAALARLPAAMAEAHDRCLAGPDELKTMIDEGLAWYRRWKEIHPQFNVVED